MSEPKANPETLERFRVVGVTREGEERALSTTTADIEAAERARDFLAGGDTYSDVRIQRSTIIKTRTPWADECDCDPDGRIASDCRTQGCRSSRSKAAAPTPPALDAEDRERLERTAEHLACRLDAMRTVWPTEAHESPPELTAEDSEVLEQAAGLLRLGVHNKLAEDYAAGVASGMCTHCEGEMDAIGGLHLKTCPLANDLRNVASHHPEPQQEGRGELRDRLLDELEKARQWHVAPGRFHGDALSEEEVAAGGVQVVELAAVNAAIDAALNLQGEEGR